LQCIVLLVQFLQVSQSACTYCAGPANGAWRRHRHSYRRRYSTVQYSTVQYSTVQAQAEAIMFCKVVLCCCHTLPTSPFYCLSSSVQFSIILKCLQIAPLFVC
jgi:hypothetical protein